MMRVHPLSQHDASVCSFGYHLITDGRGRAGREREREEGREERRKKFHVPDY